MTTDTQKSPPWGTTVKLVVGLTLVAIFGGVLLYYRDVITSLILAFVLTYVTHPIIKFVTRNTRLSWQVSTSIIFILMLLLLLGGLTLMGFAVAQQLQSLIKLLQGFIADLPDVANTVSDQLEQYGYLGEFINLNDLANRAIETLQPILGQAGTLVRSVATGAAVSIGKLFFVFVVSYFLLADADKIPEKFTISEMPDYAYDFQRLGRELHKIWNAFLRGQLTISGLTILIHLIILPLLGLRYSIALALMTGLARFVPYVGGFVLTILMSVAAFFQTQNYFGLSPWAYTILVLGVLFVIDRIMDNLVTPRFFGKTLKVHPATVLIAALITANLFGLVGLFLAAPLVATFKLLGRYVIRKMLDLDPWPEEETKKDSMENPLEKWGRRLWEELQRLWERIRSSQWARSFWDWLKALREKIR